MAFVDDSYFLCFLRLQRLQHIRDWDKFKVVCNSDSQLLIQAENNVKIGPSGAIVVKWDWRIDAEAVNFCLIGVIFNSSVTRNLIYDTVNINCISNITPTEILRSLL